MFNKQLLSLFISVSILATPITSFASNIKLEDKGEQVTKMQTVLKDLGYFENDITGYFGKSTQDAVKLFQSDNNLKVDGIVGNETKKALGIDSEEIKDWFNYVQYVFPRDGEAVVTDIDTGKSFNVKRTFGTNHADVEPLTIKDTEIIKDIWGGFSWERRAVIVNSNGNIIAGSMTAFPHAGVDSAPNLSTVNNRSGNYGRGLNFDVIKNNGVDGHMDIHFLNSKTHGTQVIQESHQNMVIKANDYINKNY